MSVLLAAILYVAGGTPDQTMDVYWPTAAPSATVLFIHGGSLQESGERRDSPVYAGVCKPFVAAGIACATMDYRLAPKHRWPAMPEDVVAAIAKLRPMISEHGGDPSRLFLFGHSSGCHLAALVAASYDVSVAGVIAMGCTLDREDAALRHLTADQIRAGFARDADDVATYGTAENWLNANPASFLDAHTPPALIVVAQEERFMPPILEQGSRFARRLLELGVFADVVIVPGTHMSSIRDIGGPHNPTFAAIRAFIASAIAPRTDKGAANPPAPHKQSSSH